MGMYTRYEVTCEPATHDRIVKQVGYDPFEFEMKWYGHEKDMIEVSKLSPGEVITLDGEGEEQGDQWVKHFKDGVCVTHRREAWDPPGPPEDWTGQY